MTEPLVVLRGLTRTYEEGGRTRVVLDGVNAELRAGERVVLLGRSGSGKSTLLNLVSGIDRPTAGDVTIDGRRLTAMSERERTLFRRRHIGFVFQFFNLIPTLTVAENLRLPLELSGLDAAGERVPALLDRVGLADRGETFPDRLSGGEQQRVAIARALIHEPALLLADEPTGNLDEDTGRRILDLLFELGAERGQTLLMVTHDPAVAARADRVLTLDHGRLLPAGDA